MRSRICSGSASSLMLDRDSAYGIKQSLCQQQGFLEAWEGSVAHPQQMRRWDSACRETARCTVALVCRPVDSMPIGWQSGHQNGTRMPGRVPESCVSGCVPPSDVSVVSTLLSSQRAIPVLIRPPRCIFCPVKARPPSITSMRPRTTRMAHVLPSCAFAAAATRSGSNPNFLWSSLSGADAPNVFMPIMQPDLPT